MATTATRIAELERRLIEAERDLRRATARLGLQSRFRRIQGVLDGDLVAATNALDAPSTAKLRIYLKNLAGDFEDSGRTATIICRYTEIATLTAGRWMKAEYLDGEWSPYAPDCGATVLD